MDKIIIVASKKSKNIVYAVDTETYKVVALDKKSLKADSNGRWLDTGFNIEKMNYFGDNDDCNIETSIGTLFCKCEKHRAYGLIKENGKSLAIYWFPDTEINSDRAKLLINNNIDNLKELTDLKEIPKDKKGIAQNIFIENLKFSRVSYEDFIGIPNSKDVNTLIDKDDELITECSNTDSKEDIDIANKSVDTDDKHIDIEKLTTDISNRLLDTLRNDIEKLNDTSRKLIRFKNELKEREKLLNDKEETIKKQIEALSVAEKISTKYDVLLEVDTIIGDDFDEDDIIENNENDGFEDKSLYYSYEHILKVARQNDTISLPMSVFRKLKVYAKNYLYYNQSYTEYKMIAKIKFETTSEYMLYAYIEVKDDCVRFTIVREFDNKELSDRELSECELKYIAFARKQINFNR